VTIFSALSLLLASRLAGASILDGSCPSTTASSLESLSDSLDAIPTTVRQPSWTTTLCDVSPRLTFDANLEHPTASLSIPLSALQHEPMTLEQFLATIDSIRVPSPWASGETTW